MILMTLYLVINRIKDVFIILKIFIFLLQVNFLSLMRFIIQLINIIILHFIVNHALIIFFIIMILKVNGFHHRFILILIVRDLSQLNLNQSITVIHLFMKIQSFSLI
jgi:hypothetical protein